MPRLWISCNSFLFYFIFLCHTIITKNIGKEEKKKWRGDLTETIGTYERLGLLELWARAVSHQWSCFTSIFIYLFKFYKYLLLLLLLLLISAFHLTKIPLWNFGNSTCSFRGTYSGCTDARLVIVLVSGIQKTQKSGTEDNNFDKWKGTFWSDRPTWPDRSKWTIQSCSPIFRWDQTKMVRSIECTNQNWMESAQYHYYLLYRMTCFMGVKTLAETILALFSGTWDAVFCLCVRIDNNEQ